MVSIQVFKLCFLQFDNSFIIKQRIKVARPVQNNDGKLHVHNLIVFVTQLKNNLKPTFINYDMEKIVTCSDGKKNYLKFAKQSKVFKYN